MFFISCRQIKKYTGREEEEDEEEVLTDTLQFLLQMFQRLLNGSSVCRGDVCTEHAQQTVQLLRELEQ